MRLLQLQEGTLSLVEFRGSNIPRYAILSHTWGLEDEEVNFQDVTLLTNEGKVGYRKLYFCGEQAKKDGLDYFWVDTCCIDKTNLPELSEAINSMFRWYQKAEKCYVYLSDVACGEDSEGMQRWKPAFRKSRWFTRGWTLQELIAPRTVEFYSSDGSYLGNKETLEQTVHEITDIPIRALQDEPFRFSLKDRESWLGTRETTIEEDSAYCLLGIFDIHLPLIYGEGRDHAMRRLRKEIRDHHVINLPIATGASFNSHMEEHKAKFLPNTRTDLLHCIKEWVDDRDSPSMFWLSGIAGTGKSTVARTVATYFADHNRLGASFFFKKGEGERGTTARFFSTIAADLAACEPGMVSSIKAAQEEDPSMCQKTLRDQFEKLILHPLLEIPQVQSQHLPLVIVIDALDECEQDDDIRTILQLLSQTHTIQPVSLRVLVTSRPDLPIRIGFKQMPDGTYQNVVLHEIPQACIAHDILVFLEYQLGAMRQSHFLSPEWPGADQIQALVDLAVPLFIYAATVCRYIGTKGGDPEDYLNKVLAYRKPTFSQLDRTYLPILDQLLAEQEDDDKATWLTTFKELVGCIVLLESPLSVTSLARLLQVPSNKIMRRLDPLHSVLSIPDDERGPVRILHLSFREFLIDSRGSTHHPFWVDRRRTDEKLLSQCMGLMSGLNGFRQNICDLPSPGTLCSDVDDELVAISLSPELQYACRYWIHHLEQSGHHIDDGDVVHEFLRVHLLHWIEAMSLLDEIDQCVPLINKLQTLTKLTHSATTSFLRDAQRFILAFQNILRQAPLQTYSSALTFAPESSIVRTTFKDVTPTWVELLVGKQRDWSACRSTLEGHTNQLTSINFSPDGKVLASGSGDKSIRIWDVSTGSCRSIMTGHRSWVNAVAFSSDGSLIASASRDETIRLWSTNTWSHKATLHGHTESVETLAWSQDCQLIASGSHDKTVKLWDVDKQSCYATLEVHTNLPRVAVSPDNRLVASTYDGNSIRIWDVTTMLCHNIIDGYSPIHSISFSQDSQALAVVLYFWTEDEEFDDRVSNLRLFNVETGQNYSSFYAGLETRFVAFSSNSDTVILVDSNTLHLWDYRTGVCHTKLEGCTQPGFRAAISPDEMSVATLHLDNIVKIWDVAATDIVHECDLGPSTTASEVSWDIVASPDDKLFIFYSSRKVLVWDSTTGALIGTLDYAINVNDPNKMQYDILDLKFSPDGRILAYTSKLENKIEVRLLDTQTWLDCTFFDHTYRFHKVQFSQDGELLLSTSHDGTVRLWNIEHGSCISMLNSDYRRWDPFCLSQNNKLVALGSDMGFVRLWNVATGSVKTLAGHTSSLVTSAFSADARLLASGSHDVTIRIWHVDTGSCRVLLEDVLGHYMGKVAFSSDSKLLASFHSFESIRLWDTKNGQCRHIFNNYDDFVMDFVFSSCGTYLQTSRGNLSIPVSAMDSHLSEAQQPPLIFVDQRWIYLNQTPIFWLPPEYSAEKIQVSGSTIGIVNEEGETIILRLCLDVLKRIEPRLFQSTNARDDIAV